MCFRSKKSKHSCFLEDFYTSVGFWKRWVVFQTHTKHLTSQNRTVYAAETTLQTDRLVSRKVVNILKMLDFLKYLAWFRVFLKILLALFSILRFGNLFKYSFSQYSKVPLILVNSSTVLSPLDPEWLPRNVYVTSIPFFDSF